jgi:hypothetical protein
LRTFSCFITEEGSSTPTLALIVALDENRARELAYKQVLDARHPTFLEVCEGERLLWFEDIPHAARQDPSRDLASSRDSQRRLARKRLPDDAPRSLRDLGGKFARGRLGWAKSSQVA